MEASGFPARAVGGDGRGADLFHGQRYLQPEYPAVGEEEGHEVESARAVARCVEGGGRQGADHAGEFGGGEERAEDL